MPLNDDPDALTDDEYQGRFKEIRDRAGDDGLHIIPGVSDRTEDDSK